MKAIRSVCGICVASNVSFIPATSQYVRILMRWPLIVPMGTSGSLYPSLLSNGKITFCHKASLFFTLNLN